MTFYCSIHKEYFPESSFYPSSIRNGETRCKQCNNKQRELRRKQDPIQLLCWKMYQSEHRYGVKNAYPTKEEVERIVERCGGKSVLELKLGETAGELCIVRMDPDLPLKQYPENAVLVTSKQSQRLPRIREKRLAIFSKIQIDQRVEKKDMDNNYGELHGVLALLGFSLKIKEEPQKNECITEAIGVIKKYIEKPPPPASAPHSSSSSSSEEEEEEEEEEDGEMHLSSDSVSSEPHTPPRDDDDEVVVEDKGFVVDDEEPIEEYDKKSWETIMKKHNEKKKKIEGRKRARPRVLRYDEEDFPGESDDMGEDCGGAWNVSVTKDMKLGMGAAYEILKFNTYKELEKNNFWRTHFGDAMSEVEANCGGTGKPNEHARQTISEYIRGPTLQGKNVEIVSLGGRRRTKCCMCGATQMCEEQIKPGDLPVASVCRHLAAALIGFYQVLYKGNPDYGQLYVDLRRAMDKVLEASADKRDKKKNKK